MKSTKDAHELKKGNSRAEEGDLEEKNSGRSTADPLCYRYEFSSTGSPPRPKLRDLDMQV